MVTLRLKLADGTTAQVEMLYDTEREALNAFLKWDDTWIAVKSSGNLEKHVRYDQIIEVEARI